MTIPRMIGLLIALTLLGIAVVVVRVDQRLVLSRIQEQQFLQTDLRREIWGQEMELARLRSPGVIRERAASLGVESGPATVQKTSASRKR